MVDESCVGQHQRKWCNNLALYLQTFTNPSIESEKKLRKYLNLITATPCDTECWKDMFLGMIFSKMFKVSVVFLVLRRWCIFNYQLLEMALQQI